jgi:hypothetical protein
MRRPVDVKAHVHLLLSVNQFHIFCVCEDGMEAERDVAAKKIEYADLQLQPYSCGDRRGPS